MPYKTSSLYKSIGLVGLLTLLFSPIIQAQIGIGTTTPEGAIDVAGSNSGLLFPRVALQSINDATTVVNPNGGNLAAGTTVFNINNSTNGRYDVQVGVYTFDGTQWQPQFSREDYALYKQTSGCFRTPIRTGDLEYATASRIDGLINQVFIPKYSGMYRIEVKTNFGAGKIEDFTTGGESYISLATSEGAFFFKLEGNGRIMINPEASSYDYTQGWSYTHAYSAESDNEATAIESYNVPHFATLVYYKPLLAGTPYTFNLRHKAVTGAAVFQNRGASGEGMGHVGHDVPCSVEFEFLGN
ncbi:PhoP regulatory network YrbL family protein [Flavobacteriaceae bacterium]|nr:PhoP regulatory network YrbL family protein [Flavobacteriaceae bacterium]